jgi:hypothetical protein
MRSALPIEAPVEGIMTTRRALLQTAAALAAARALARPAAAQAAGGPVETDEDIDRILPAATEARLVDPRTSRDGRQCA